MVENEAVYMSTGTVVYAETTVEMCDHLLCPTALAYEANLTHVRYKTMMCYVKSKVLNCFPII